MSEVIKTKQKSAVRTGIVLEQKARKTAASVLVILLFLLAVFIVLQYRVFYAKRVILNTDTKTAFIYYSPGDKAAEVSAQYLSYSINDITGLKLELTTEQNNRCCINILCESLDDDRAQSKIGHIIPANKDDKQVDYSVALEKNRLILHVYNHENCFGVVKAFTDQWLQNNCGYNKAGELCISREMIKKQLTGLPAVLHGKIKILSQNLRFTDDSNGNSVQERATRFIRLVDEYQPDLIGTQECTWQWLQLLRQALSDRYEIYGCSRLGPDTNSGEWNAVLYRKDRFAFQDGETFWLSNTPSQAASKLNYDGAVRICTWALLRDSETGNVFLFSNTHLQNGTSEFYQEIRSRQAEILFRHLRKGNMLTIYPGFLTGDFNGESEERFYSELTAYYEDSEPTAITNSSAVNYSYHNYGSSHTLIDFCFHSPNNVGILDYKILDDQYSGYVSDHYGIFITAVVF